MFLGLWWGHFLENPLQVVSMVSQKCTASTEPNQHDSLATQHTVECFTLQSCSPSCLYLLNCIALAPLERWTIVISNYGKWNILCALERPSLLTTSATTKIKASQQAPFIHSCSPIINSHLPFTMQVRSQYCSGQKPWAAFISLSIKVKVFTGSCVIFQLFLPISSPTTSPFVLLQSHW